MSGKYSNIKVVSFDMDGTILNTEADLEAAARRALKLAGLPPMPPVRFANYIGNGVKGSTGNFVRMRLRRNWKKQCVISWSGIQSIVRNRPVFIRECGRLCSGWLPKESGW